MNGTANLIIPTRLERGDTIGLVAPAGPILKEEEFTAGVRLLQEMGFKVKFNRNITRRDNYLAGADQVRVVEFHDLWRDPEVKVVLAARGGYGSLRMLPHLDMNLIRKHPKIFVGFSDITVLLTAIYKKTGLVTFHGPMVSTLAKIDKLYLEAFFEILTGRQPENFKPKDLEILRAGNAKGRLVGGNLTNLAHLVATPHELDWQGAVLFLEDVGEDTYRIDRMLTHLHAAGRLQHISGLILGHFTECGDQEKIWSRALELLADSSIPIWANFPCGHGPQNHILPLGIEAKMDSNAGKLHFCNASTA